MVYPTFLKVLLWVAVKILQAIYFPVGLYQSLKTPSIFPEIKDKILLLPASVLAKRIRKGQLTSQEVVEAYIARINEVNPILNSVIENRFEDAIKDAKKTDRFIKSCQLNEHELEQNYPLLGVPITIKGSIAVAGMNLTSGRIDHMVKAEKDAVPVKRARNSGAIPILTSNVPEMCFNWETTNKLIGTTMNPYNNIRSAGGSSGGETSLIGCGASVIGIGSDIAGSLRLPAHYCGVWGHKPTPNAVSTVGHYPDCTNKVDWHKIFTLGPLSRYATDLKLLLEVIVEPEYKHHLMLDSKVEIKKIKIYYIEDTYSVLSRRVNPNVLNALKNVVEHLDVVCMNQSLKVELPLLKYCAELSYLHMLDVDGIDNLFEGKGEGAYSELLKLLSFRSKHMYTLTLYGLVRRYFHLIPKQVLSKGNEYLDELRNDFIKMLGQDGVFICPTFPSEASYPGDTLKNVFEYGCLCIYNALGLPVTNCPVGFTQSGLPIGLQVVAAPNCDRLTLAIAQELERKFGGWRPPKAQPY